MPVEKEQTMTAFSLNESSDLGATSYGKEFLYRDCIAQVMMDDGWHVQTEVRTDLGIADLVARRNGETWVIEAKVYGDNNSIAHACGQLLFYTDELPFTKRLIAIPERLKFKFDRVLSCHGIDLFWFTPYSHTVNALFERKIKLRNEIYAEREMVEHKRLTDEAIHFTAVFLAELEGLEHAPNAAQRLRWQQAQQQFLAVAQRIDGSLQRDESAALEGELLECAA